MESYLKLIFKTTAPLINYDCNFLDAVKDKSLSEVVVLIGEISNFFLDNSPKRKNFLDAIYKVCWKGCLHF